MQYSGKRFFILFLCIMGALAVILGAFGAHGLEDKLSASEMDNYDTAVFYHLAHVLAGLYAWSQVEKEQRWALLSAVLFCLGIIFFSGSLYLLSTTSLHSLPPAYLGPVTPIGGLFFIMGWLALGYHHVMEYN